MPTDLPERKKAADLGWLGSFLSWFAHGLLSGAIALFSALGAGFVLAVLVKALLHGWQIGWAFASFWLGM